MFEVLLAALGVAIAALQWRVSQQEKASAENGLLLNLTQEWRTLQPAWRRSLLIVRGAGDFYVEAPWEEQLQYMALRASTDRSAHFLRSRDLRQLDETLIPPSLLEQYKLMSEEEHQSRLNSYSASAKEVVDLHVRICNAVLRGSLSLASVYDAFGASVLNNAAPLRRLASDDHYYYMLRGHPDRVLVLLDLLHAHGVRSGSISGMEAAKHKRRTRSGVLCRRRVRSFARLESTGLSVFGWFRAARLEYLLTWAEASPMTVYRRLRTFMGAHPWRNIPFDHFDDANYRLNERPTEGPTFVRTDHYL